MFTARDLVSLRRVSDPQISPNGRYVVYVLRETDLEANKGRTDLWLLDLIDGQAAARKLAAHDANDTSPRWSADGRWIYFLSTRSGSSQVWRVTASGAAPQQVTNFPLDVSSMRVSPTGKRLAAAIEVLPECADLDCTRKALDARQKTKSTGRMYERLFVRHWDTWANGTRSHLFSIPIGPDGKAGTPVDLSAALDADVPSKPFGGDEEYAFSPDGERIVFSARAAGREEAWSTNFDLYEVAVSGAAQPKNLTAENPAWDTQPVFLANGDLAYLATARPGFESDRFQVMLRNARSGAKRSLTRSWDRSVTRLNVTGDGKTLLATAEELGERDLFTIDRTNGAVRKIISAGDVEEYTASNRTIAFTLASLAAPADLYAGALDNSPPRRLTAVNEDVLAQRAMGEIERFTFKGANDDLVNGYVVKPSAFRTEERYPVAFVIHGGPEVGMGNLWHYRWNAQAFAGAGYGVVQIEFHGTPGYGQAFTDSIAGDWGGKPFVDLQRGLAAALEKYPWLDGDRVCALGASYGGFMVNWIEGHWPDRFRCLVNHDGIFDQRMMYYATEELWFPEWEQRGPYFENSKTYEQFNPVASVAGWHTPMLVIHGEQDFRIPYEQALATFTALQRRGIESKLLIFPNENHWVLKPANSLQWYDTVLGWLDAHTQR